jgi:Putative beta-lactamase-inhibitor-like, PepSY-like
MKPSFIFAVFSSSLLISACNPGYNRPSINVPAAVQTAFTAKYPGITPEWESQPYGYEAIFSQNGIEYEAEFSSNGQWLETEYEVQDNQFPPQVLQRVKQEYPGYAITKREIEITPRGTFYEVEVERDGQQIERYYDKNANPVQNSNEDA